jgi:hypothetical protein
MRVSFLEMSFDSSHPLKTIQFATLSERFPPRLSAIYLLKCDHVSEIMECRSLPRLHLISPNPVCLSRMRVHYQYEA